MGYYNPIYVYGVERFLADAKGAGVDGLIVVDLPPEEDAELCLPALKAGLNFIRLATPTTDDKRLPDRARQHVGLRLLRLDHRHYRRGRAGPDARSRKRSRASSGTPSCRSASASACAPPSRRARSRKAPTASWSARRWSRRCARASTRTARRRPRRCRPSRTRSRARRGRTRRPHRPRRLRAYDMTAFFSTQALILRLPSGCGSSV